MMVIIFFTPTLPLFLSRQLLKVYLLIHSVNTWQLQLQLHIYFKILVSIKYFFTFWLMFLLVPPAWRLQPAVRGGGLVRLVGEVGLLQAGIRQEEC